ncbi:hypothetical protein Q3G72_027272 [Acer saccharum]|nr:hypothetical protein Q3G72_027272 [Acer saccharum]
MGSSSPPLQVLVMIFAFIYWVCIFAFVHVAQAQNNNQSQATTDPNEATYSSLRTICLLTVALSESRMPCTCVVRLNLKHQLFWEAFVLGPALKKVYALDVVGVIPDELWTLTFLTNLTVGINALSGELPKELGKMTDIRSFGIGSNNFSGPLPSELGNWIKLEQLYIDSSGVSGEIPSTLAKLQNMATMWASDTELTGRIPDFIGNWSKLTSLRFHGNSFDGPIPSSFSKLTALTELKISDLSNGSSTLAFMKDMKSLSFLELRNNNISDSIPSNIGEYRSLKHLFLGNNKLNGTLPPQKNTILLNMNVVANNLTIDNSNSSLSSALPFGLNCLQRNFPCYRGAGIYYNFSIKAGGPQITSSNGIVYERDNATLGPASYFVTDTRRWGVSNVGSFAENNNPRYISSSSSQFTNTLDSELFQTARISASSLRYYDFIPSVSNIPPTSPKKNRTGLIAGIVVGVGLLSLLSIIAILWIVRRRNKPRDDDEVLLGIDAKPYTFSYSVLKTATEDFSPANKLGEGGFGAVYKGKLSDGRAIAVKQLSVASQQGKSQFVAEIVAISAVQHQKTDVFAFGVVALEIVSGRPNSDSSLDEEQMYLLEWAWNLHENNRQVELVDSRLPEFNEEVKRMIGVALLCTQTMPSLRPPMSHVVAMLYGDMEVSPVTTKPGYLTDWKYDDTSTASSFMSSDKATIGTEYNSNFTSSSTTVVADAQHSPANVTKPILHDIIGDGRW